ncbi:MAG: NADH-quinone oxidoreductase subunit NuoK [SAR324 cluster bacterium]|nr:NADH-quinone oxidoreductase subunit NuoK [SAR324 cluster bacterium]
MEFLSGISPGIEHWLILSALLFSIGIYGVLVRKNAVGVLLSAELMLNAGILNFVIFNYFITPLIVDGELMALFLIAVAAAEAVVGMAIFVAIYKHKKTVDVTRLDTLKG